MILAAQTGCAAPGGKSNDKRTDVRLPFPALSLAGNVKAPVPQVAVDATSPTMEHELAP